MTPRLRFLLSKAEAGIPLWDVACDHGLLGEGALASGDFPEVHFVDPLAHRMRELQERLAAAQGVVLHAMRAQEVTIPVTGNVVIAGIGGDLMHEILRVWAETGRLRARRLILSPHKDVDAIPRFARTFDPWRLVEHACFNERGRSRDVFVYENAAEPGPVLHAAGASSANSRPRPGKSRP